MCFDWLVDWLLSLNPSFWACCNSYDKIRAVSISVQVHWNNLLQKSAPDVQNSSAGDLEHICSVQVNEVYMFMGRELEALDQIPAGNILGTLCKLCCIRREYCIIGEEH